MNVVNPNNTSHTLNLIPRYYSNELVLEFQNEATKVSETITNTASTANGILSVSFDYTFIENQKMRVKITDESGVVYRGKLLATSQELEDYKLTNGLYYYE